MKIPQLLSLVFFLCSGLQLCWAKLGDTEADCIAKYGAESDIRDNLGFDKVGDKSATFSFKSPQGPIVLGIVFLGGSAAHESMTRTGGADGFSDAQIQGILASESGGLAWTKEQANSQTDHLDNTVGVEVWLRADGATAQCWTSGKAGIQVVGEIDLSTREYAAAQGKLDRENGAG